MEICLPLIKPDFFIAWTINLRATSLLEIIGAKPPKPFRYKTQKQLHKTTRNVLPKQIKQNYRFIDKKTGNEFAVIRKVVGDDEIERVLLYDMDAGKQLKELFAYDELFARFEGGFQK